MLEVDEIEIARVSRDKEIVVVPPDLGASDKLQPIVDLVDGVLRDGIAARMDGSETIGIKVCTIIAVMLTALGVFGTGTGWPDIIVASAMAALSKLYPRRDNQG